MNRKFALGVDIGGSHITVGLIDLVNKSYVSNTQVRKRVNSHASADEIISIWAEAISEADPQMIYNIGIAMPGPFDYENGISLIKGFNKYESLYEMNIRELLSDKLKIDGDRIRFRNDAEAFLEGEVFCGAAKGYNNAIGITLGTGMGSAISKDGITVDAEMSVTQYKDEIIEECVSTRGLVRTYYKLTGEKVENVKAIADRFDTDKNAVQAFKIFADDLSWILYEFIQKETPEILVIGGNIINCWSLFMDKVIHNLSNSLIKVPRIEKSILGEASALIGGACCFKANAQVFSN